MNTFTLHHGDAIATMAQLPANHFDACILDGPYNLSFMGSKWDSFKSHQQFQSWYRDLATELLRILKPGAHFLSFGGTRSYHRMICGIEDAGFEIRDCIMWVYGSGFPKSHNLPGGLGTALKPAWEPICVARKPLVGTIADNHQLHGTGVFNIDAARIPGEPWTFGTQTDLKGGNYGTNRPSNGNIHAKNVTGGLDGRWPANIIHDGSPEVTDIFPHSKSGAMTKPYQYTNTGNSLGAPSGSTRANHAASEGSAARFFYCAKASRADRNEGLEDLATKPLNWSSGTQSPGTFQSEGTNRSAQNNHPTVKPTALIATSLASSPLPADTSSTPAAGPDPPAKEPSSKASPSPELTMNLSGFPSLKNASNTPPKSAPESPPNYPSSNTPDRGSSGRQNVVQRGMAADAKTAFPAPSRGMAPYTTFFLRKSPQNPLKYPRKSPFKTLFTEYSLSAV